VLSPMPLSVPNPVQRSWLAECVRCSRWWETAAVDPLMLAAFPKALGGPGSPWPRRRSGPRRVAQDVASLSA
jgi:hypothetical protein